LNSQLSTKKFVCSHADLQSDQIFYTYF
jgi:hypothetical protein